MPRGLGCGDIDYYDFTCACICVCESSSQDGTLAKNKKTHVVNSFLFLRCMFAIRYVTTYEEKQMKKGLFRL